MRRRKKIKYTDDDLRSILNKMRNSDVTGDLYYVTIEEMYAHIDYCKSRGEISQWAWPG